MKLFKRLLNASIISAMISTTAMAGTLVINSDQSDPAPKKAFAELIAKFEATNPDIDVKYNLYDKESYKTTLRNWLVTTPPDVVFWYAGNRMKSFVDKGLFEDVSDLWTENDMHNNFPAAKPAMTVNEKQWGVPYTYYQWGIYYRKDIFEQNGISEPQTWEEYLKACEILKAKGIAPIAIGTKYLWTAAGWFDYMNMRINGLDFHIQLMDGKIPYTDERVKNVFKRWEDLVRPGYYLDNHSSYSWQEAQPYLYDGSAAMYLIGNFITPNFPAELDGKMGYFQFPVIDKNIPLAEDAPMDTVHIPSKAKNKEDAKKFLKFMAQADNQTLVNKALLQIPPHKSAKAEDNYFLNKGVKVLAAASTAQFYDRDTDPAMAKAGMKGFQEFMVNPDRLDKILQKLEKTRKRIFK